MKKMRLQDKWQLKSERIKTENDKQNKTRKDKSQELIRYEF